VPVWLKIVGAIGGVVLTGFGILAIVWNVAIGPVNVRLDALERSRTEGAAAMTAAATRLQNVEGKVVQVETSISTGSRIRDQQQQGMVDQIRSLNASDQAASERLATLANTIASILPRLEEILRRQERLENRLGARSGSAEPRDQPVVRTLPSRT
jgi:predicted  nucleic acid-binding Zn-ribbon protein